jgi:multidrug efflux pump subunit AcrA (membrane-fusion protein)
VSLDGDTSTLGNGSAGELSIVTQSVDAAVAVPSSAVTTDGTRSTVTVLSGDSTKTVNVRTGVTGGSWTEITNGLTVGETVVLADLDAALPTSATSATTNNRGGPGAFPGGGGFVFNGGGGGFTPPGRN